MVDTFLDMADDSLGPVLSGTHSRLNIELVNDQCIRGQAKVKFADGRNIDCQPRFLLI